MSHIFFLQSGGASCWRVCYQRGLPRLVLTTVTQTKFQHALAMRRLHKLRRTKLINCYGLLVLFD